MATNRNKTLIPTEVLEKLKCIKCRQYLSVPTTVSAKNGGCYICGRCIEKYQDEDGVRAKAYETLAELFLFPCRYLPDGCKKNLQWGHSAANHEDSCDFRTFECPSLPLGSCSWIGTAKDMAIHFKDSHRRFYMNKPFFPLRLEENIEKNNILSALDETFLVQLVLENNKFYICVKYVGKPPDSGKFYYEIEMRSGIQDNMLKICSKVTKAVYKFDINRSNMNEIDVSSLMVIMKTTDIICHVNVFEKSSTQKLESKKQEKATTKKNVDNKKQEKTPVKENKDSKTDKNLLGELRCPVCQLYMIPPIYICRTGHSVCRNCIITLSTCPTCFAQYSGTRNYTLEKLTTIMKYPCLNQAVGCKFTGTVQEITNHESVCSLFANKCPLEVPENCNWRGSYLTLKKHVINSHHENTWMKLNTAIYRNLNSTTYADFHVVEFDQELFKISCKHSKSSNGPVQWSFQHLGLNKEKPKYKCEIEFLDVNDSGRKFIINDICCEAKDHKDTFNQALEIPSNLLVPFMKKNTATVIFKYNISQI